MEGLTSRSRALCDMWQSVSLWPGVRFGQDADRIVVLNVESGSLYTLDGLGRLAWEDVCLKNGRIAAYLSTRPEPEQHAAVVQLETLLCDLQRKKIVAASGARCVEASSPLRQVTACLLSLGLRLSYRLTAAGLLAGIRVALLTRGFGPTLRFVSALPVASRPLARSKDSYARAVSYSAALFPGRAECLEQSLSLVALLRSAGLNTELEFGARAYPLLAHAWAECNGVAVNEHPDVVETLIRLRGQADAVSA